MKQNSTIKIIILAIAAIAVGVIIFLLQKKSPNLQYEKYVDSELGFEINYPKAWTIDKGDKPDLSRYKYVKFSGELDRQKRIKTQWCDPNKYPAFIEIEKGDHFSNANFGPVNNEEDLENFFNSKTGVIEKFPASPQNNLLISKAYTGVGQCFHSLYIGWLVTDEGEHYHIRFSGDEDRYDLIRPVFESFKLIN